MHAAGKTQATTKFLKLLEIVTGVSRLLDISVQEHMLQHPIMPVSMRTSKALMQHTLLRIGSEQIEGLPAV